MKRFFKRTLATVMVMLMVLTSAQLGGFAGLGFKASATNVDYSFVIEDTYGDSFTAESSKEGAISFFGAAEFSGCYGNQLSDVARELYDSLVKSYAEDKITGAYTYTFKTPFAFNAEISGGNIITYDDFEEIRLIIKYAMQSAMDAFLYDHPEVFWLKKIGSSYYYSVSGNSVTGYNGIIEDITITPTEIYSGASSKISDYDAAVDAALDEIIVSDSRYDTLKNIHDYICKNAWYNLVSEQRVHSSEPFFIGDGGVVCEGYAKTFKVICDRLEIPCVLVSGDAGGAHMWNYVQMDDGKWYLVDATWDDQESMIYDTYFIANANTIGFSGVALSVERTERNDFSGAEMFSFTYPVLSTTAYTAHVHEWESEYRVDVEPTCTEKGSKSIHCKLCSKQKNITEIEKSNHKYIVVSETEPTCTVNGECNYACDMCGVTRTETIAAEHTDKKYYPESLPETCYEIGYTEGVFCGSCCKWIEGHEEIKIPHTDEDEDWWCDLCPKYSGMPESLENELVNNYKRIYEFTSSDIFNIEYQAQPTCFSRPEIDEKVAEITADCETDYDKVYAIYKWIVDEIYYDYDGAPTYYYTPSDVLKYKRTVCSGYAMLFSEMCRSIGIPCRCIAGSTYEMSYDLTIVKLGHEWNEVFMDEKWVPVDATWDSNNKYVDGEYLKNESPPETWENFDRTIDEFISQGHYGKEYSDGFATDDFKVSVSSTDVTLTECLSDVENIVIPEYVTSIGYNAFYNCDNIESVCYAGTEEQWKTITIGDCNEHLKQAAIYYNHGVPHSMSDYEVTKESSCSEEGLKSKRCSICGYTVTETIAKLPHTEAEAVIENKVKPGCEVKGSYDEVVYCSVCYTELLRTAKEIAAMGHDWELATCTSKKTCLTCGVTEGGALGHNYTSKVIKISTCTEVGSKTKTCTICGHTVIETIEKLPHTEATAVTENRVEPKCEVKGSYDEVVYCSVCDTELSRTAKEIPAIDHRWAMPTCISSWICLICNVTKGSAIGHKYELYGIAKSTCTTDGKIIYGCTRCSDLYTEVIPATGHKWNAGVINPVSTCKTHGTKTYTCQNDATHQYSEQVALDSNNHEGDTYIKDNADATCTVDGYTGDTYCSGCDEKIADGEVILATGHDWDEGVINPISTCKTHGTKTYTCQNDATHQYSEQVAFDSNNHEGETEIRNAVEANCGEAGYTGDTYCLGCNTKIADGEETPATGRHNYVGTVTKAATCKSTGVKTYTCSVCNDSYTDVIPVDSTNHEGGTEIRNAVEGNCGEAGYTGDTYCLGCNTKIADGEEIPATGRHNYVGTVTKVATCKSTGVKTYTCSVCNDSYTDVIPVDSTNHEGGTEIRNAVEGNCGEAGYTGDTYCLGCNTKIADGEEIPATGRHNYVGTVTKAATCKSTGVKTYTCSVCGDTYTDAIPVDSTNHEGGTEIRNAVEGNCGEAGYTGDTYCSGCDEKIADGEVIPAVGHHTYGNWTVDSEDDKKMSRTCTVCGDVEESAVYLAGRSLLFKDIIQMRYYFDFSKFGDDVTETGLLIWTEDEYAEADEHNISTAPYKTTDLAQNSKGYYYGDSKGIPAKNMIDKQIAIAYAVLSDGTIEYTEECVFSPVMYSQIILAEGSTSKATMKTLAASLMNYGAAAQNFFNYKTETPMNAWMSDELKAVGFDTSLIQALPEIDNNKLEVCNDDTVTKRGSSLTFVGNINQNIYFDIKDDVVTDAKVLYWTEAEYKKLDKLTTANAHTVDLVYDAANSASLKINCYRSVFEGVAAKDLRDAFVFAVCYKDAEGNEHYSTLFADGAHDYVRRVVTGTSKQTMKDLAKAFLMYHLAAEDHLLG